MSEWWQVAQSVLAGLLLVSRALVLVLWLEQRKHSGPITSPRRACLVVMDQRALQGQRTRLTAYLR